MPLIFPSRGRFVGDSGLGGQSPFLVPDRIKNTPTNFAAVAKAIPGCVLYLPLGEASGTTANDSMLLDDGTYTGTVTLGQTGLSYDEQTRTSVLLDGTTGYINVPASKLAALGDNFTIVTGLKRSAMGGTNLRLYDRNPSGDAQIFISSNTGTVDHWQIAAQSSGTNIAESTTILNTSPHLIAWTKAGATNHMYQDGQDVTPTSVTNVTIAGATGSLVIGQIRTLGSGFFNGYLQDYVLYNRALTFDEITLLWQSWGVPLHTPTPYFICGPYCDSAVVANPTQGHWQTVGTAPTITNLNGRPAWQVNITASQHHMFQSANRGQRFLVTRFYIQLPTLPSANVTSFAFMGPNGSSHCDLGYTQSSNVFNINCPQVSTTVNGTTTLVAGHRYRIDWRFDVANNPFVCDWMVDGVPQPQATFATAGDTLPFFGIGTDPNGINDTYNALYQDIICSNVPTDYPFGDGYTLGHPINIISGTHNQTAGDLQDNTSTNITNGDASGWFLQETPADTSTFIKQVVARTTTYAEYPYVYNAVAAPRGVNQIVASAVVSGTTGTAKAQLYDGTNASDMYGTVTPGGTTLVWYNQCWPTAPTYGPWTQAQVNAARMRWGFSSVITGSPYVSYSLLEAEYAGAWPYSFGAYTQMCVNDGAVFFVPLTEASSHFFDVIEGQASQVENPTLTRQVTGPVGLDNPLGVDFGVAGNVAFNKIFNLQLGDGPFSIEMWFKRDAISFGAAHQLVDWGHVGGNGPIIIVEAGNTLRFNDSSFTNVGGLTASAMTVTDTTTWHHVVACKNGASRQLYLDAVQETGGTNTTLSNARDVVNLNDAGGSFQTWSIAGFAVYLSVLSSSTVTTHYNTGQPLAAGFPYIGGGYYSTA